jgi:pimeloyl-ACP methyl ester carboxylesterase
MVQQLRRTVDDRIETKLPKVQAPALVVRGRYDQTLSQPWTEEFTRLLPDGRLVVIEGAADTESHDDGRGIKRSVQPVHRL